MRPPSPILRLIAVWRSSFLQASIPPSCRTRVSLAYHAAPLSSLTPFPLPFPPLSLPSPSPLLSLLPPTWDCVHNIRKQVIKHTMGKVHGSLARAGKVKGQTPKVEPGEKKKQPRGRAKKRMQYNRRYVNVVTGMGGRQLGPNSNADKMK
mmetsp:Transcript_13886/g.28423  ORF Transcript_13886/g.28423 Transcript_13886/m.28423 type:complete len:150 (-) Transcript_13886:55-504(-)